ncbi:SCO family protein [Roseitranquillus sediminis]|uniref:SCO family protein n=1 Tax=Roseitranquillus sediminis TaxID=2809051 RepID=UPI001D0CA622|nr:SCO family protein [Roseitranquillus sediminis]MBM9596259.1 SCO family protein [Roseitranquillus sediminis]
MRTRKFYAGAAVMAIVALVAGPVVWTMMRDTPDCGGGVTGGDVGGPFDLVSETGATVTDAEVIDRPALVYFGYTFCPDICPFDAARNAEAVDLLAEAGHDVKPVFITVDPERDTPEVLAEFTDYMHPEMVGLTGSAEQIAEAARAYRVYHAIPEQEDEYYLVDHTTFTYLMMPGKGFVDFFSREDTAEEMAARTACYLDSA